MHAPDSTTSRNRASSSGSSGAYCAWTSTSGIVCTASQLTDLEAAINGIRRERDDACDRRVLEVLEVVVEALVARPEPVPRAGDCERPDRRADQRQHEVRRERDLEDAGRDRHERPDE